MLRLDDSLYGWGDFFVIGVSGGFFHFRHVATQVKGVAEPHHNRASGWPADPIKVISDRFHGSIALNGVGQTEGFGHGITFETAAVLRIHDWTGLRQPIRVWLSLCLSAFLKNFAPVVWRPQVPGKWLAPVSIEVIAHLGIRHAYHPLHQVLLMGISPVYPFSGSISNSSN